MALSHLLHETTLALSRLSLTSLWGYAILRMLTGRLMPSRNPQMGDGIMERIKTLNTRDLCESAKNGGCGECQTSCQSACKTSCGVANQQCENTAK